MEDIQKVLLWLVNMNYPHIVIGKLLYLKNIMLMGISRWIISKYCVAMVISNFMMSRNLLERIVQITDLTHIKRMENISLV